MVDDRSGAVEQSPDLLAGDRAAQWMRWIHEGSHSGPVWPIRRVPDRRAPLGVRGLGDRVIMWWRGRRSRKSVAAGRARRPGELQAAE